MKSYVGKVYNGGAVNADVKNLELAQVSQTLTEFEQVIGDFL